MHVVKSGEVAFDTSSLSGPAMSATDDPAYLARLEAEGQTFDHNEDVHDLPDIFHYWSNRYLLPKFTDLGFVSAADMMTQGIGRNLGGPEAGVRRIASLGAGNCDFEIDLAKRLLEHGHTNFVIECLELSGSMLERGRAAAEAASVASYIEPVQVDLNAWKPSGAYHALVAVQSLHHVLDLEGVFASASESLAAGGQFLVCDTIGRNGHMRWPEAMRLILEFWRKLPPSYRYNRQLQRYEELYENWDCSTVGFEGIRAQDILPVLAANFRFDMFLGYGNIIDPFIDRCFGPNFDPKKDWDRTFIDEVHRRDEEGLATGELKPTQMMAALSSGSRKAMAQGVDVDRFIRVPGPSDDVLDKPQSTGHEYPWGNWPDSKEAELERAYQLLGEAQKKIERLEKYAPVDGASPMSMKEEIHARARWAMQLEKDLAERTAWALKLEAELKEHQGLRSIWEKRSIRNRVKQLLGRS